MIIYNCDFRPSLLMILITLSGLVLFTALGLWQLQRAAVKQVIVDNFENRLSMDFKPFEKAENWSDIEYKRVLLQGRYDTRRTLLLDNQLDQGRAGYHVLSPFELSSGEVLLVDRGWVASSGSRAELPVIDTPLQLLQPKGIVTLPTLQGFRMGEIQLTGDWPQVIPYIDIAALQPAFSNRLLPVVIWLAAEEQGLYKRDWQPVWLSPEKSRAYALQWFCFAAIALILFVVLNLRKVNDRRK